MTPTRALSQFQGSRKQPGYRAILTLLVLLLAAIVFIRQRLHPIPLPPFLAFLLENPITAAVVGPNALLDRLELSPGMRVLDAGCGPGRLTTLAARRVGPTGEVVGLDSQEAMLRKLRGRLDQEGLENVRVVLGQLGSGHLREREVFDRAILAMVLGEVRDRGRALRELHAALKPGGILSITEAIGDPDYRGRTTVRREAEAVSFQLDRVYERRISYTMNFVASKP